MAEIIPRLIYGQRYQLECYEIAEIGLVPVIDNWVQFSLTASYIPVLAEQTKCLQDLSDWTANAKQQHTIQYWHFLRKPPGMKVRWRLTNIHGLVPIISHLIAQPWPWLTQVEADSVFGQRELLQGYYPDQYAIILDEAVNALIKAPAATQESLSIWIKLILALVLHAVPDEWLAWEALGRFERLRSQNLMNAYNTPLIYHPRSLAEVLTYLLPQLQRMTDPDASGLLMLINYLFNIWAVDTKHQAYILAQARAQLRPALKGSHE